MRGIAAWADRLMFSAYTAAPGDLAVYRVFYGLYVLLAVAPVGAWVGGMPRAFFSPPVGPAALADGFPSGGTMLALNAALVIAAALLTAGWRTPAASLATGALLLIVKSWEYADGKINHDVLVVLAPLLLAFSGWGGALSVDAARRPAPEPSRPRPSWALGLMAFTIGVAMFSAGALKLITGWLDPAVHSTYGHLVVNNMGAGRDTWLSAAALATDAGWLWEPADWAATLLELAFILAMLHPRVMRAALAVATLFHLGVWLLFDIVFSANIVAYAAFVPWAAWMTRSARLARWIDRAPPPRIAWSGLAAALALGMAGVALGEPLEARLGLQLQEALIIAGAGVGAAYLARPLRPRTARRGLKAGLNPSSALPSPPDGTRAVADPPRSP